MPSLLAQPAGFGTDYGNREARTFRSGNPRRADVRQSDKRSDGSDPCADCSARDGRPVRALQDQRPIRRHSQASGMAGRDESSREESTARNELTATPGVRPFQRPWTEADYRFATELAAS